MENPMPKNILMITDGRLHPPLMGRFWLRYVLAGMQGFNFARVNSMEEILNLDLSGFHGMVLYFHHDVISEDALNAFDAFVSGGGGALAIHSVTASFKESDHFTEIIGGKFTEHGPVEAFTVMPVKPKNEIFGGIQEFQVTDELYLHDLQPDIKTHFNALHQDQLVPMVWTRHHGTGRVCYACPGHRAASMRVVQYQQVLMRGLEWVCSA
jgi:type 1 glutamine amidotransferase